MRELRRLGVGGLARGRQHVFRQAQDDGTRASVHGGVVGAADVFGDALGFADDGRPFDERTEQRLGLDLLEGFAILVA